MKDGAVSQQVVAINASGSKLDAYLSRALQYEVGRCVQDGKVQSRATIDLRSDVPLGERPPPYMLGQAEMTDTGPIHSTYVQFHLPRDSRVNTVTLNGEPVGTFTFEEQSRPGVLVAVKLPPRKKQRIAVDFTEPADDGPAHVVVQPLQYDPQVVVTDRGC